MKIRANDGARDKLSQRVEGISSGEFDLASPISEEAGNGIRETLHLLAIPGMRNSIHEGMTTPLRDCSETLDW